MTTSTPHPAWGLVLLMGQAACTRPGAPPAFPVEAAGEAAGPVGLHVVQTATLEDVTALACSEEQCIVALGGDVHVLDLATLEPGNVIGPAGGHLWPTESGWATIIPCPPPGNGTCLAPVGGSTSQPVEVAPSGVPDRIDLLATWWNGRQAEGGRVPFAATMPTTDGRAVTWMRGDDPTASRLLLRGGGMRAAPAPGVAGAIAYPRTVALHPTGQELYVLVWPGGDLIALAPMTMGLRWELSLPPAAHGLFVDPTGRWLLAESGGDPTPDRLLDFDTVGPSLPEGAPVGGDPWLALADRPDATTTTLVDLAAHAVALSVPGRYRAWTAVPGSTDVLLATTDTLVRFTPTAPSDPTRAR